MGYIAYMSRHKVNDQTQKKSHMHRTGKEYWITFFHILRKIRIQVYLRSLYGKETDVALHYWHRKP